MLAFFAFIVAMFISMVLIPPLMKSARRYSFLDTPDERKLHTAPTPRIGGIAMVAGAVTPMLLWVDPTQQVLGMLYGIAIILVFGVWDDRANLSYKIKFAGQLLAVVVAVYYGDIVIRFVPFHSFDPIPDYIAMPLTVFALLGVTNAINLSDGLDGLAGGTTLLSVGVMSLLAYAMQDRSLFIIAMALMGCIVGFLRYNTHPAQIFMGDCGSQFLGFSTGVLVIALTQDANSVLSPAMPLLLLGLPLIDTFLVMGQRIYEGRSPFKPDRNHFHHKLLELGFDHYEAVVIIYSLQAALVTLAYVLRFQADLIAFSCFIAALVGTGLMFRVAHSVKWRARAYQSLQTPTPLATLARRLKQSGVLYIGPVVFCAVTIPVYATALVLLTPSFPSDATLTAYLLSGFALLAVVVRRRQTSYALLERLLFYVTITTVVYYWSSVAHPASSWYELERAYLIVLCGALMVSYRFMPERTFSVTPTDFLIIFIALLAPTLSGSLFPDNGIAEIALKVLILFYAAELIVSRAGARTWVLRAGLLGVLGLLAVRVSMTM